MKKLLRNLLSALLLVALLPACAAKTDAPQSASVTPSDMSTNETQSAPPQEAISDISLPQESSADASSNPDEAGVDPVDRWRFDPYWQLSDTDPFLFAMRDNPIDAIAPKIMEDRVTTMDMAEGLYKIYDLWVAEMEYSLQQLLEVIEDDSLKQQLLDSQTAWEAYIDASQPVNERLITQDGENWGTIMLVVMPDIRIEKYRERTILLKYLFYLYTSESGLHPNIPQFLPIEP